MENKYYVYALLNPLKPANINYLGYSFDYEVFYIGKGSGNRVNFHFYENRDNNFLKNNIINKIKISGNNVIVEKLEMNLSEKESFDLEIKLINNIGKRIDSKGTLSNMTDGGEGRSGCNTMIENNPFYGKEHRKESLKGRYKPVLQYTLSGEFIKRYNSLREASIETNSISSKISNCCKGYRNKHNNFKWEFENDVDKEPGKYYGKTEYKSILQIDLNGEILKKWESINDITSSMGMEKSNLIDVLKGRKNTSMGYKWEYS